MRTVNALCAATRVVGEQHDGHAVCSLGANLRHAARHDAVAAVPIEQVLIVVVSLEQGLGKSGASVRDEPDGYKYVVAFAVQDLRYREYGGATRYVGAVLA